MNSPEYLIVLISFLTLKHFFADFPLQSNWMISQKGYYGKLGGIVHAGIHGIFSFLIVLLFAYTDSEYGCREHELDCDIRKETLKIFGYGCVSDRDTYVHNKPLPYSEKEFVVLYI